MTSGQVDDLDVDQVVDGGEHGVSCLGQLKDLVGRQGAADQGGRHTVAPIIGQGDRGAGDTCRLGDSAGAEGLELTVAEPFEAGLLTERVKVGQRELLGLLVRLVGPIMFVQMLGAFWFAHRDGGVFVSDGGWELVAVIGAAGLALAGAGAGRISLDYLLMTPLRRRRQAKESKMMVAAPATGAAPAGDYSPVTDSPAKLDSHTPSASTSPSARNAADADFAGTDRTSGLNSGRGIDPDAPTTQWPGNSRKI